MNWKLVDKEHFIYRKNYENFNRAMKKYNAVIIHGKAGIGKTMSVYIFAEENNYKVYEWNASDSKRKDELEEILRFMNLNTFEKTIYLFDEAEKLPEHFLLKIADLSSHTQKVVLTCNKLFSSRKIKEKFEVVRYNSPNIEEVIKGLKKMGVKGDFSKVSTDIRGSINAVLFGSENISNYENEFEFVEKFYSGRERKKLIENVDNSVNRGIVFWILENISKNYFGKSFYLAHKNLAMANYLRNKRLLEVFPTHEGRSEISVPRKR